jgi:hypothetical protein
MKKKKTYKELKDEYKREFERIIKEMEEFRDNTDETSHIKEFEVPLPPKYLIDKKLKTKTYLVRSIGSKLSFRGIGGPICLPKPSCLDFHRGRIKKKNIKIDSLFRHLSPFIPDLLLSPVFHICFEKYDIALKTISERRRKERK